MEEAKGVVMHVVLAKFKDGIAENKIEEIIKDFANLVNLIEPMKSFNWGKDVSSENLNQGFTHIFEWTFESTEGVAEYVYVAHPAHVDFANLFLSHVEKVLVIDYKPTAYVRASEERRGEGDL
ncbi:stress-response A/B barrel domain-containing protein HS1-like isoform X2 [Pyrus communis]|uniref:stress-response A/B barrel domain-containing protein HS1-like isoform X2 n=1 Tax=Pyrus communis TaxID=23211 RepID=UPI0035BF82B4